MRLLDGFATDQVFSHIDSDGTQRHFAATAIRRQAIKDNAPRHWVKIEQEAAEMIKRDRGIEKERLELAMQTQKYEPLIICEMSDNTHLLIDGSHSYVAMAQKGIEAAEMFHVPEVIWRHFLIEGLPDTTEEALRTANSGFTLLRALGLL